MVFLISLNQFCASVQIADSIGDVGRFPGDYQNFRKHDSESDYAQSIRSSQ